jgi:hypothetical protein
MTIAKCQARNPATCTDPQCPLEKHKEAETKTTHDNVTAVSKKFAFARTPQEFEKLGNEYQTALMEYDSSRGGLNALQEEYDATPDSVFTEKDILFARLESAKERYAAKYGDPQGPAATASRESTKKVKPKSTQSAKPVQNTKPAKITAEDIANGWDPDYPDDHPANHPFEREERSYHLELMNKRNHVNHVKDSLEQSHTYKIPKVTTTDKGGYKVVAGEKATPSYESPSAVTKKLRLDIKEAVAANYLPKNIKFSVTADSGSGSGYRVNIQGLDDSQIYIDGQTNEHGSKIEKPEIAELKKRVEKMMGAYNSTLVYEGMNRDQPRYYTSVQVEDEKDAKWRDDEKLRASLRKTIARHGKK